MATNLDDITDIRAHYLDTMTLTTVFDNDPDTDQPTGMWARLSVIPGAEFRQSIASRTYEQLGRAYLQVFVPEGTSDNAGWQQANLFVAAFRDWSSPDYRVRFATPEYRTSDAEDGHFMILVTIPYTAQH